MKTAVEQAVDALRLWSDAWNEFDKTSKNKPQSIEEVIKPFIQMEKEQKKELVIGTYIDLKIKNNKLPYGLEYLNKLAKVEEKAKQYYNEKFTNLSELPISSKQQEQ